MSNVVDLPRREPAEPLVFKCGCGCLTHYVRDDGTIECAACEEISEGNGWWREGRRDWDAEQALDNRYSTDFGGTSMAGFGEAIRFVGPETTTAVIVIRKSGAVTVWQSVYMSSRPQRGWLRRKLEIARKLLTERKP